MQTKFTLYPIAHNKTMPSTVTLTQSLQSETLSNITPTQLKLLNQAGVHNIQALAEHDPFKLHRWLTELNTETRLVRKIPDLKTVYTWIEAARKVANR